jgi:hypothetical protein
MFDRARVIRFLLRGPGALQPRIARAAVPVLAATAQARAATPVPSWM